MQEHVEVAKDLGRCRTTGAMITCATVHVDGTAVHTIDYTDELSHEERTQGMIAAVVKRVGAVG